MTRIIAGKRGGSRLQTPDGRRTRPTAERVREALFSTLVHWVGRTDEGPEALAGISVLDLYAGSGAIGLEAASRGAAPVLCVESDRFTAGLIERNASALRLDVDVRAVPVETLMSTTAPRSYDIVWADPPYKLESETLDATLAAAAEHGWIAPDGLFVVERARRSEVPVFPTAFPWRWERRYGETTLFYATVEEDE